MLPAPLRLCLNLILVPLADAGRMGLHKAALEGATEPLKVAINGRFDAEEDEWKRPDINGQNKKGQVALHNAVCNGRHDPQIVSILLEKGADPNARNGNGETALHVVARLCDHLKSNHDIAMPAMHLPTAHAVTKLLVSHGADASAPLVPTKGAGVEMRTCGRVQGGADTCASTPLHIAAQLGHFNMVELFLRQGADPNRGDVHGSTPLHYAARELKAKVVHALIAGGADVDIADDHGILPRDVEEVANGKDSFAKTIREHFNRARQIRTEAIEQAKKKDAKRQSDAAAKAAASAKTEL